MIDSFVREKVDGPHGSFLFIKGDAALDGPNEKFGHSCAFHDTIRLVYPPRNCQLKWKLKLASSQACFARKLSRSQANNTTTLASSVTLVTRFRSSSLVIIWGSSIDCLSRTVARITAYLRIHSIISCCKCLVQLLFTSPFPKQLQHLLLPIVAQS